MKKAIILSLLSLFTITSCGINDKIPSTGGNNSSGTQQGGSSSGGTHNDNNKPGGDSQHGGDSGQGDSQHGGDSGQGIQPEKPAPLLDFTNYTFESKTFEYDGFYHSLEVFGLPYGTRVDYYGNNVRDVGTHKVTIYLSKEGYNSKTDTATITILPAIFKDITFTDRTFEFDDNYNTISITGNLPSFATVTYSCKEDPSITNKIKDPGTYTITAKISAKNYEDLYLTATFTIKSKDKERFITTYKDEIYFQNALDKENLYKIDLNGELVKVNSNNAQYFTEFKNNLIYRSDSLLSPSIVSFDGSRKQTLVNENAQYIVDDENYIYFAKNSLLGDSGIFRLDVNSSEPRVDKIYHGNAYDLHLDSDVIYFRTKDSIKSLNVSTYMENTLVNKKVKNFVFDKGDLYYTVNELKGDYIEKYDIFANRNIKLTSDAGKYLTVINDELYYVNADLLNANLFGKGIYKVGTSPLFDSSLPGKLVIPQEFKNLPINSLKYFNGNLYFYQTVDQHLYSYNLKTNDMVDLMSTFVPKEPSLIKGDKAASIVYNDIIYYQNQYDDGCLYSYNPNNKQNIRITSNKVDHLFIYNDYLYYRAITALVNKDLYRLNLKTNETILISTNDCKDLTVHNDKIYYTNLSGKNEIHVMNLDGTNDTIICNTEGYNLEVYNNRLYFIVNSGIYSHGYLHYIDLNDPNYSVVKLENIRTSYFKIHDNKIIYRELSGFNYNNKSLSSCDLDGNNNTILVNDVDPTDFVIVNNNIYYNNDVINNYSINCYDMYKNSNYIIKKDVFAYGLQHLNGKLYYHSYLNGSGGVLGDGHYYELSLDGTVNRID